MFAMPERRRLAFDRIEDIMPDVDRLIAGHATVGRWSLGAICDHLARTINLSLDSPPPDAPASREQAVKRRLFFRAPCLPRGPDASAFRPDPDARRRPDRRVRIPAPPSPGWPPTMAPPRPTPC